jgi:hypothetical protein
MNSRPLALSQHREPIPPASGRGQGLAQVGLGFGFLLDAGFHNLITAANRSTYALAVCNDFRRRPHCRNIFFCFALLISAGLLNLIAAADSLADPFAFRFNVKNRHVSAISGGRAWRYWTAKQFSRFVAFFSLAISVRPITCRGFPFFLFLERSLLRSRHLNDRFLRGGFRFRFYARPFFPILNPSGRLIAQLKTACGRVSPFVHLPGKSGRCRQQAKQKKRFLHCIHSFSKPAFVVATS